MGAVDPGKASCYAGGVLLGIGWWIMADGAALCGLPQLAHLFRRGEVPARHCRYTRILPSQYSGLEHAVRDTRFTYGSEVATRARCFVVLCMAVSVAALNGLIVMGTFVMRAGTIAAASTY
ncbi:unnamed protein product [Hyaloperonospora brassicae]|uniref:Amino acid transporter transmembrane domain-containing protein n=1 Tax=Hyaloperonospora brassicae TaxID=162125 RepID=A0AAV0UQT6_HYABA|nr:unnamed protein product [Hyaloperonospora brassicae]